MKYYLEILKEYEVQVSAFDENGNHVRNAEELIEKVFKYGVDENYIESDEKLHDIIIDMSLGYFDDFEEIALNVISQDDINTIKALNIEVDEYLN